MTRPIENRRGRSKLSANAGTMLLRGGLAMLKTRDIDAWGLTPRGALIIALVPILVACAVIATIPSRRVFVWVIDEDSLVENIQFILILAAGLFFSWSSARLLRTGRRGFGMLYALVALATFFVAGEEISWGQRILGLRTPEALEAINWQREISVHNVYGFHQPFIYAVMLAGLYGTIVPLIGLAWSARRPVPALAYLLIPPVCLVPAFFTPFGYRLFRMVFRPELAYPGRIFVITEFSEVTELCFYFGVLVFAWLAWRRLRHEPQSG